MDAQTPPLDPYLFSGRPTINTAIDRADDPTTRPLLGPASVSRSLWRTTCPLRGRRTDVRKLSSSRNSEDELTGRRAVLRHHAVEELIGSRIRRGKGRRYLYT